MNLHNWENPTSAQRNELVFANRNQNYGAYEIRQSYERTLLKSFLLTCSFVIFLVILPRLYNYIFPAVTLPKLILTSVILDVKQFEDKKIIPMPQTLKPNEIIPKPSGTSNSFTIPIVIDSTENNVLAQELLSKGKIGNGDTIDSSEIVEIIPENSPGNGKSEIKMHSEEMPSFPGGEIAMLNFISKNLTYPEGAKESKISGIVYITFVVDVNGDLKNIETKRGIGGGCEQEAIRVLNKMPRWNPGKDNGRAVNVEFILPIKFTLK